MSNWKIPFADCERVEPCDFNAVFLLLVSWRKRWRGRWEVGRRMEGKRDRRREERSTVLHHNEDLRGLEAWDVYFCHFLGGWLLIVWVGTEREEGGKGANAESTQYRL